MMLESEEFWAEELIWKWHANLDLKNFSSCVFIWLLFYYRQLLLLSIAFRFALFFVISLQTTVNYNYVILHVSLTKPFSSLLAVPQLAYCSMANSMIDMHEFTFTYYWITEFIIKSALYMYACSSYYTQYCN